MGGGGPLTIYGRVWRGIHHAEKACVFGAGGGACRSWGAGRQSSGARRWWPCATSAASPSQTGSRRPRPVRRTPPPFVPFCFPSMCRPVTWLLSSDCPAQLLPARLPACRPDAAPRCRWAGLVEVLVRLLRSRDSGAHTHRLATACLCNLAADPPLKARTFPPPARRPARRPAPLPVFRPAHIQRHVYVRLVLLPSG